MAHRSEHRHRSILKAATWRVAATTDTIFLSFLFTGSITSALAIGGLELFTKSALYYLHERAWLRAVSLWTEEDSSLHGSHRVSLLKAVSWRFFGFIDTAMLALIVTGSIGTSASIGGTEIITKIVIYYLHERIWARVQWGKRQRNTLADAVPAPSQ